MMDEDNFMDMDKPPITPQLDSPFKHVSASSINDSPRWVPSKDQIIKFNSVINNLSIRDDWPFRVPNAGNDEGKWRRLINSFVLSILSSNIPHRFVAQWRQLVLSIGDGSDLDAHEIEEWTQILKNGVNTGHWERLLEYANRLHLSKSLPFDLQLAEVTNRFQAHIRLDEAYHRTYIGVFAASFIDHLKWANVEASKAGSDPLYAKAISVVQSSGTGKSRMLSEAGKKIFTLPICLRERGDAGFPPADDAVVEYFRNIKERYGDNDLSYTAHLGMACFDHAAKTVMLQELRDMHHKHGHKREQLLFHWHAMMEPKGARNGRNSFFKKVVQLANETRSKHGDGDDEKSPKRDQYGNPPAYIDPAKLSGMFYDITKKANENLAKFISHILPDPGIFVMYFDEADQLDLLYWVFLRLMQHQDQSMNMWYVFMGTKSTMSYYSPPINEMRSLRLSKSRSRLLPPYIDLGFDQQAILQAQTPESFTMREIKTVEFLSRYGRPMWSACLPEEQPGELIDIAVLKLLGGQYNFDPSDVNHVFAVLSQRLCLELTVSSEAVKLADRSVAYHMRLLTDVITTAQTFYTYSPSEPILALGSFDILYNRFKVLPDVLTTLSRYLCSAGLVEKGVLGELGARILLLTARDFAAPFEASPNPDPEKRRRNLLEPVRLLDMLYKLFKKDIFIDAEQRKWFENALSQTYVNFTHWILTRESLPEEPNSKLLANLWLRGAALQCCHNQGSIDCLIPCYDGSVDPDAPFNPSRLTVTVVQIKFKGVGDIGAEDATRPIGVPRDPEHPLPYLALLMELGNKSKYQASRSKIKCKASEPTAEGAFKAICDRWTAAVDQLAACQAQGMAKKRKNVKASQVTRLKMLQQEAREARRAKDSYNRFSISARGISEDVYGILQEANIVAEFGRLMGIVMTQPIAVQPVVRRHMRPLEGLRDESDFAEWMSVVLNCVEPEQLMGKVIGVKRKIRSDKGGMHSSKGRKKSHC